jgi:signal transduction histidine kinase
MSDETPRVLSLLSHELRGPLGVIRGYLRLIEQTGTELSDQSRQSIAAALRASDRMVEVLEQASLLGHLQIGDVRLDPKPVTLATLVEAAVQRAGLPENCTVLVDSAALPDVTVDADRSRLGLALGTLIGAVARPQSPQVTVNISAALTRLNNKAAVDVRIGPRILADSETTAAELDARRGGFGLTIPIAALIVEKHGGRVRELKQGDRFAGVLVSLPTSDNAAAS